MSLEGNYSFAGIGAAEAKDRFNEHRTGVPPVGGKAALLSAPVRYTTGVDVMNQGSEPADIRLAHGSSDKAVTAEILSALVTGAVVRGQLAKGAILPGSLSVTDSTGSPQVVSDVNADGLLLDGGGVQRGTINYLTGELDLTFAGAAVAPVTTSYTHNDFVEFAFAQTQTFTAAAGYPEQFLTQFGRIVPGTVTLTDGALTLVDDAKGNMIETTGGIATVVGTIDYALGQIDLTSGTGNLNGGANLTIVGYSFNPFGSLLQAGGTFVGFSLLSPDIPEIGSESFADGVKGESRLALIGECRTNRTTNLLTRWYHHCEEPYRVKEEYTAFGPGGQSNDPRLA
jgi:hypothetical protein